MKTLYQRVLLITLFLFLAFGLVIPVVADGGSTSHSEATGVAIDSALNTSTGEKTVIVRLSERPEEAMQATSQDQQPAALKAHADETQSAFERFADGNPHVEIEERFWITNAILVTVDLDKIPLEQLGTVENVEEIHEDAEVRAAHATSVETAGTPLIQSDVSADSTDSYTWGLETIGVPETWDGFDNRGDGVSIAVLDSGVDGDHPDIDIDDSNWKDFDDDPSDEPIDYGDHGTHVSGTVVGGDASGEYIGVAPDAELYHGAVLTLNDGQSGNTSTVISGIQWAVDEDVDIVSLSLGADGYNPLYIDPIRNARQSGTIPVAASGNTGEDVSASPANVYDSMAVGATTTDDNVASYSNGEIVDTSDAWFSPPPEWPETYAVPDVSAPGGDGLFGPGVRSAVPGGDYDTKSGTSMAAPHVSGSIALMLSNGDGELTPDEIQARFESTAVDIGEDETRQGAGRIDVYSATLAHSRETLSPTITPDRLNVSVPTEFAVEANHPVAYYHWEFSDGTTVTTDESTVEHTFDEKGTETVTVTLEDTEGENVTTSTEVSVVDELPPTARLSANRTDAVEIGLDTVEFDASESTDNHEIDRYEWSFSDGRTTTTESPILNHTYTELDDQDATVTVVDASENTNTTSLDIDVTDTTPPHPVITAPETAIADTPISLSAANSTDNDAIETFDWELGDGTTANGTNITHSYSEEGTTDVTLTTTDRSGNENTTSTEITVQRAPTVSVTEPSDESYVSNSSVSFEYTLSETNSEEAVDLEYRLLDADTSESVVGWTAAPFESTADDVSLSTVADAVDDGQYTAEFRIVDAAGQPLDFESAADSVTFTVKTTAPELTLAVEPTAAGFDQFGPNNPAQINTSVSDPINDTAELWVEDSDGTVVSEWDLSKATGNGTATTVQWNGTDETATPVDSGEYEIGVTANDSIGNSDDVSETVTVDTDAPSVSVSSVDGGILHGETVYLNDSTTLDVTVDAADGRESADALQDVTLQAASDSANYRLTPSLDADSSDGTVYTGTLTASEIDDEGSYTLSATVTDAANNTAKSADTSLVYDRASPQISAVITDVDPDVETGTIRIRSSESLSADPSVTVTPPNGSESSPTLTQDGDRWTGSFEVTDGGQYELSATGVDLAGNSGSDTATTTVESVSTANRTTTVYSASSGMFIRFNTADEVANRTVAMTESDIAPEALTPDQLGVQFLTGDIDTVLAAELENATIGVPTDSDALPGSVEVDDEQVSIEYYDDGWESQPTSVETVDVADGVSGEYWTTTVESFSTYGVTVEDTEPPTVTDISATRDENDEFVTITARYEDSISGIDVSSVSLTIDGTDVTGADSTSITSSTATHSEYPVGDETYDVTVELEDAAGNNQTETRSVSVESVDDDDDEETESSGGSSSSGGGGGGGGSGSGTPRAIPTPVPDDVRLLGTSDGTIRGGEEHSTAQLGGSLDTPVVGTVIFDEPGLDGDMQVRDYDGVPDGMGAPPGAVVSTSEVLVPWQFAETETRLRFSLANAQESTVDLDAVDTETLTVWRHTDGEWEPLETRVYEGTGSSAVLEATTPGFSYFVITDAGPEPEPEPEPDDVDETTATDDSVPGFSVVTVLLAVAVAVVWVRQHE